MKKYFIGIASIIIAIGLFFYFNNKATVQVASSKQLTFGAIISQSSYAAEDGESVKNGLELAKADLAKEGITVNIDYFDDGTDPKKVVAGIQYMKSKNIDIVFGPLWSFLGSAALGVVENTPITLFGPSMTSESTRKTSKQMLYGQVKNSLKLESTVTWLKENNIKKPAIIVNQGAWGETHAKIFSDATNAVGGKVVMNEEFAFGKDSEMLPALILKAKKEGADAILWSGSNDGSVILVKELTKLNMPIPLFADEEVMTVIRKGLLPQNSAVPIYTWKKEMNKEFIKKYKEVYGVEPNHYSDAAYDMLMIAAKTVTKSGSTKNMREQVEALNYTGYTGLYQFDENGDRIGGKWEVTKINP